MIKTDVENFFLRKPGVVIQDNPSAQKQYIAQKKSINEKQVMQSEINIMVNEIEKLKELVNQLIAKGR